MDTVQKYFQRDSHPQMKMAFYVSAAATICLMLWYAYELQKNKVRAKKILPYLIGVAALTLAVGIGAKQMGTESDGMTIEERLKYI